MAEEVGGAKLVILVLKRKLLVEKSNQQLSAAWQLQITATGSKAEYPDLCDSGSLQVTSHPLVRLKA